MPAAYPTSIKTFVTYQDQPGPDSLVLDTAFISNEMHNEIVAIEQVIGIGRYWQLFGSYGKAILWAFNNLAPGYVDAHGVIDPTRTPTHTHLHMKMADRGHDDHTQYVRVDGARGFSGAVTSPPAIQHNQLANLGQVRGSGLTADQAEAIIQATLKASRDFPVTGPGPGRYRMAGGVEHGPTDANGNLYVSFAAANFSHLVSFVYMKMPFPGLSMLGWPQYQYIEDQLILLSLSPAGAWIQFIEDIAVDRQASVAMVWIALGY